MIVLAMTVEDRMAGRCGEGIALEFVLPPQSGLLRLDLVETRINMVGSPTALAADPVRSCRTACCSQISRRRQAAP